MSGPITAPPRIPLYPEAGLSAYQREVYEKVASGPRGAVVGPMRAALHSPELADLWQAFGEFLRYRSSLAPHLSELVILVCGRYWNSEVEWYVHSSVALEVGVPQAVVEAIRSARPPVFDQDEPAAIYEYARQLVQFGKVDDAAYAAAWAFLGSAGVVELTALTGYYTMVAMTLNAHNVPPPEAKPPTVRTLDALAAAAGGETTALPLASVTAPGRREA